MKNWQEILNGFVQVKVLVVGDVMLDRYWLGNVSRISPEAPVPIVNLEKTDYKAGGAANVAANIRSLGGMPFLIGVIGCDETGRALQQALAQVNIDINYLIKILDRPTTSKTRIIAHQQQIVRIDDEKSESLAESEAEMVWRRAIELMQEVDVIILSDYAKGCLCDEVLTNLIEAARASQKPILIDPKGRNYSKYNGATLITPNKSEAIVASNIETVNEITNTKIGERILENVQVDSLLMTLSEDGMQLFERNKTPQHFPTIARQVYDVTGAGDTVIATLAMALGTKADLPTAVQIANIAAGLAVEQIGTTAIEKAELERFLSESSETKLYED